jgi:uncharacterized membrane protein (DUF4010 family)
VEDHFGAAFIAIVLGGLLGLERQRSANGDGEARNLFAGIRTFALFSLSGYLGAHLAQAGVPHAVPAVLIAVAGLVTVAYFRTSVHDPGLTSEMAALVSALLGALIGFGQAPLAVAIGVVVAVILAQRDPLHRFVAALSEEEVTAVLKFAIVAVVLLPLLPDRAMGPFGAIVPRHLGFLVAAICGLGLAGYVLVRWIGSRAGFALAGFLGGLVSSTAVTLGFSARARTNADAVPALASGIVLASTIVYLRGLGFLLVFEPVIARDLWWRALLVAAVGGAFVAWGFSRQGKAEGEALKLENPVDLGRAASLGLVFAGVLVVGRAAQAWLGTAGFWATSAVAGLVDVDSVLVTGMDLHEQQLVTPKTVAAGYLLATVANLAAKGAIVVVTGGKALARRVLPGFLAMALTTALLLLWP